MITIRDNTPWGVADYHKEFAPGIDLFETPSHGGVRLSRERFASMPTELQAIRPFADRCDGDYWYEEDCDIVIVIVAFPELFEAQNVASAKRSFNAMLKYFRERGYTGGELV